MFLLSKKSQIITCLGLLIIVLLYWQSQITGTLFRNDKVAVWIFNVGQGDAIFIDTPVADVLIDGGPDKQVLENISSILPFWDRTIEIVVNTHPHVDHYTGLISVLNRYTVEQFITGGQIGDSAGYEYLIGDALVIAKTDIVVQGDQIDLGGGVMLRVLWPTGDTQGKRLEDPNAGSIVLLLEYQGTRILLMGDAGVAEEFFLKDVGDIDVLKVGHHGSQTASGIEFLELVQPEYSIISVGENNSYGHPNPITLDRLYGSGSWVLRTDINGAVRVLIDEFDYTVKTFEL